jgi:hypothetical protein
LVSGEEGGVNTHVEDRENRELDHQIARIGWALLFIMTGGLLLLPSMPQGTWLIGIGVILVGAQLVRFLNHIPMWTFSLILGTAALLLGLAAFARLRQFGRVVPDRADPDRLDHRVAVAPWGRACASTSGFLAARLIQQRLRLAAPGWPAPRSLLVRPRPTRQYIARY